MDRVTAGLMTGLFGLFAATAPASTNYALPAYEFGNGGGTPSSTTYGLDATAGAQTGSGIATDSSLTVNPGPTPTKDANVPPAPTFTNPDNSYNRLRLTLNTSSDPSDTIFAIAISSDNFTTTQYIQADNTIGSTLDATNYQTYAAWGAAPFWVHGLQPGTTYKVKVKAMQGKYSETGYGPTATAATVMPSLTFSLSTSQTSTPPFTTSFVSLAPGAVYTSNANPLISISTNALMGGKIYIYDTNTGLESILSGGTKIDSSSIDLSSTTKGYGAQVSSTSQDANGPLSSVSPFNGSNNQVGGISPSIQPILSTPGPITNGSATILIKARSDGSITPNTDYNDTLTFIAAMGY